MLSFINPFAYDHTGKGKSTIAYAQGDAKLTYWRMQLHPAEPGDAVRHSVESLAAGFIGLDFSAEIGDLRMTTKDRLPEQHKNYWAFAHEMSKGDRVLVFTHQFPFALATVDGDYNYIRTPEPEIGVWFRHFRRVRDVGYYGDFVTNAHNWETLTMTATITPLREHSTRSYQLIEEMAHWMARPTAG